MDCPTSLAFLTMCSTCHTHTQCCYRSYIKSTTGNSATAQTCITLPGRTLYTSAKHADLANDITCRECQAHNCSAHAPFCFGQFEIASIPGDRARQASSAGVPFNIQITSHSLILVCHASLLTVPFNIQITSHSLILVCHASLLTVPFNIQITSHSLILVCHASLLMVHFNIQTPFSPPSTCMSCFFTHGPL